jgi:hypothetical protein
MVVGYARLSHSPYPVVIPDSGLRGLDCPSRLTGWHRWFRERCATRRNDGMSGKLHRLYRQAMSRWAVASRGCTLEVKELALKGTGEARGKPPRRRAWLRTHMVSQRSGERPTGKSPPASRSCPTGQRPHPLVFPPLENDRNWRPFPASATDVRGQPDLPSHRSGYREERDGSIYKPPPKCFRRVHQCERGRPIHGGCSPR